MRSYLVTLAARQTGQRFNKQARNKDDFVQHVMKTAENLICMEEMKTAENLICMEEMKTANNLICMEEMKTANNLICMKE